MIKISLIMLFFAFLKNLQKPPRDFEYTARRRMRVNPILGFLWWTA